MVPLNEMEVGAEMAGKRNVSTWTKVLNVKWVKHCGNTYRSGLAVCVQVQNDMPVFHVIQNIVIKDEHILLITTALKTLCLDEHIHAYKVADTEAPYVLEIKDILHHKLFDILMSYGCDSDLFIVPYSFM